MDLNLETKTRFLISSVGDISAYNNDTEVMWITDLENLKHLEMDEI
jgi:hypothetical protein